MEPMGISRVEKFQDFGKKIIFRIPLGSPHNLFRFTRFQIVNALSGCTTFFAIVIERLWATVYVATYEKSQHVAIPIVAVIAMWAACGGFIKLATSHPRTSGWRRVIARVFGEEERDQSCLCCYFWKCFLKNMFR